MENLDEFMRRKFNEPTADDDARFDFKEEYWLQAEALIKQDERRRRAAIWWWRTGVATALLLLLLLLLWRTCGQYSVKTDAPPLNQQQARQTQRPQTNKHIPEAPLPTHPNQPLGNLLITTPSDTALANGSWHPAANELPAYPGHNPHPDHTAKSNAALHQPAPHKPSNTNPTPHIPTPAEAIKTPKSPDADDLSEQASAPTLSPHLVRIETLGLLDLPFPGPSPDKMRPDLSPVPNPVAYTEVPDVNRHWVWYAQTGATTYPDISPDWSFHAGAGVIRPIRGPWSWHAGINGRVQHFNQNLLQNIDSVDLESTSLRYSFGFERTETRLNPHEAYWLETTIGLGWQYKIFRLGAGLSPGMLLTLTGKETQLQSNSFNVATAPSMTEKTVRLNPDDFGFRRFYLSTFVNVQARVLTPHLHLYTQANWCPQSLQKTAQFTGARQKTWFDFGVHWQFNP